MIEALITSKTRIKLLLKFFLNPENKAYLRGLSTEFDESSNAIRVELNRLESAKLITSYLDGNKKMFAANLKHPLYASLQQILLKHVGIDIIIQNVLNGLGNVRSIYLGGSFANGLDSSCVDIKIIGNVNGEYLKTTIAKSEAIIQRKIRCEIFEEQKLMKVSCKDPLFLVWEK